MINIKNMILVEKVKWVASTIELEDNQEKYQYFEEMMNNIFSNDPELPIIKEKVDNLITILNSKIPNNEELESFLDLDLGISGALRSAFEDAFTGVGISRLALGVGAGRDLDLGVTLAAVRLVLPCCLFK